MAGAGVEFNYLLTVSPTPSTPPKFLLNFCGSANAAEPCEVSGTGSDLVHRAIFLNRNRCIYIY